MTPTSTDRRALLQTVREDGRRLDRYIQNLLDMTRIGGGITLSCDWIGVDELIGSALGRLRRYQPGVQCTVEWDGAVEPVWVQPALLEQAIFNVILTPNFNKQHKNHFHVEITPDAAWMLIK